MDSRSTSEQVKSSIELDSTNNSNPTNTIMPIPSSILLSLMRCPITATDAEKMNMLTELTRTSSGHTKYYFNPNQAKELATKFALRGNKIAKYWTTSIYPMPSCFDLDGMDGCYTNCISGKLKTKVPKTLQTWQSIMKLPACDLSDDGCCDFAEALISDIDSMSIPEGNACIICLNGKREYACIPCGHKCMCDKCKSNDLHTCPICRRDITMICRIFE